MGTILAIIWLYNDWIFGIMYMPYLYALLDNVFSTLHLVLVLHVCNVSEVFAHFCNFGKHRKETVLPSCYLCINRGSDTASQCGREPRPDLRPSKLLHGVRVRVLARAGQVSGSFLLHINLSFYQYTVASCTREKALSYYISSDVFRDVKF